jgi:nucleotide sugar dehydrogenase
VYNVGIIGLGFVGKAVMASYSDITYDKIIDPFVDSCTGTYETISDTDAIYVCVPSPQNKDGSCDTTILTDVLLKLKKINYKGTIISKVTAPADTYRYLNENFENLVYVPEFLVAKTFIQDYLASKYHVIGGKNSTHVNFAKSILQEVFPNAFYHTASIEEASMMKYIINSFLATKVIFMNEIKMLCDRNNINFDNVVSLVKLDDRMGNSHMQVPGPDGLLGFGGACFPKDTNALLTFANKNDILLCVLKSAIEKNKIIR